MNSFKNYFLSFWIIFFPHYKWWIYCSTLSVKLHFFVMPFKWAYLAKFISALWGKHNGKPSETNVNNKSSKLTCYKFLWLSRENGKETNVIICENRSVPFQKEAILIRLDQKGAHFFNILVVKVEICYFLPSTKSKGRWQPITW